MSTTSKERRRGLKRRIIGLLVLILTLGITVSIFLFFHFYPEKVGQLEGYGYMGAFLVSLASCASIFLPVPGFLLLVTLAAIFNPVLVGLIGAAGGTIGELTGYMLGYGGRVVTPGGKLFTRIEGWMKRWGSLTIFLFAFVPFLPVDLAGLMAGALRFPVWKFLLACFLGKASKYVGLLLASAWGIEIILRFLN